jgi:hypothetical protein
MRYIEIPSPVTVTDLEGNVIQFANGPDVLTFERFVLSRLADPKLSATMANVLSVVAIRDALKKADGGTLELEDADHEILKELVKNPSPNPNGTPAYPPGLAHNFAPFMLAVVNAKEAR